MMYAKEVMGLLAAFPGREFRMLHIVNSIAGKKADAKEKKRVRIGVWRVLNLLAESGQVNIVCAEGRGASARYSWAVTPQPSTTMQESVT